MGTKNFSNYESLITFTRASGGHALRPVSYGDELVTNGTFDSDVSGWTAFAADLTVSGGELVVTNNATAFGRAYQGVTTEAGKLYQFSCDVNYTGDAGRIRLGTTSAGNEIYEQQSISEDKSVVVNFVAQTTTTYIRIGLQANTIGESVQFDNVSVKEVTFDEPDGTLTLFEHPDDIPRVEWDSAGNRLGLLVEESRTNLITYSEDFSQSTWSKIRCSVSEGDITAPDGTVSAFVVTPATGLNTHYIADIVSGTSGSRTISFFAKKKEYSIVFVGHGIGAQEGTYFDLDSGSITSEGTDIDASTITPLPNGWYRCAVTFDSVIEPRYAILAPCESSGSTSFNPDGSSGVYVWGAQFEAGSFPTSYIKSNSGSTTTRSADVASIPVADFGYNQSAGTFVSEFQAKASNGTLGNLMTVFAASDNTTSNRIRANSTQGLEVANSGVEQANLSASFSADFEHKYASAYKENDFAFSQDGGTASTDTSGTVPAVTQVEFGRYLTGRDMTGHIKSIKYYPRRLTNAQLQALTS